jgi:hypothetical protein
MNSFAGNIFVDVMTHLLTTASSIKPHLTPENMEKRVEYCRSFVDNNNNFVDMMDQVDIDE